MNSFATHVQVYVKNHLQRTELPLPVSNTLVISQKIFPYLNPQSEVEITVNSASNGDDFSINLYPGDCAVEIRVARACHDVGLALEPRVRSFAAHSYSHAKKMIDKNAPSGRAIAVVELLPRRLPGGKSS